MLLMISSGITRNPRAKRRICSSAIAFCTANAPGRVSRHLFLCTVLWSGVGAGAQAQMVQTHPDPTCQLTKAAEVQMSCRDGHYVVPVDIGGHSYPMVLGIGADRTALFPGAIQALGLAEDSR